MDFSIRYWLWVQTHLCCLPLWDLRCVFSGFVLLAEWDRRASVSIRVPHLLSKYCSYYPKLPLVVIFCPAHLRFSIVGC